MRERALGAHLCKECTGRPLVAAKSGGRAGGVGEAAQVFPGQPGHVGDARHAGQRAQLRVAVVLIRNKLPCVL